MSSQTSTAPQLTEKQWHLQVTDLARYHGWRYYHTFDSRRSIEGFPDLVLFRPGRFLMVELKTDKGRLTAAQKEMLNDLIEAGVDVAVWRPDDFDQICEVLK